MPNKLEQELMRIGINKGYIGSELDDFIRRGLRNKPSRKRSTRRRMERKREKK